MNEIKLFENSEFGRVRVVMRGEDPWFVASDVATCLGYANPREAIRNYCKKAEPFGEPLKSRGSNSLLPENSGSAVTLLGDFSLDPQTKIIPESDLYRLIMRSHLPTAERFQDWVVEEVLPQIRKTGMYMPDFNDPAKAARAWADEYERRRAAEAEKQKAQAALVQEQSAHATTYRRYEAQNQQLVQAATLCHSLANTLGVGCNFKSCIAQKAELVKWFHIDRPDYYGDNFYRTLGKFMSKLSRGQVPFHPTKYRIQSVPDAKYDGYGAYQIEAWADFFAILRAGQFNLLFPSLIKRLKGSKE